MCFLFPAVDTSVLNATTIDALGIAELEPTVRVILGQRFRVSLELAGRHSLSRHTLSIPPPKLI
jgi:hypothetical protein